MKIYNRATLEQHSIENPMFMVKNEIEDWETIRNAGGMIEKFGAYELVKPSMQKPCFAVKVKNKAMEYLRELEIPNEHLKVKPLNRVPWQLPTEPQPYGTTIELWNEVKQCIYKHVDLPEPESYTVLTAWTFASWLLERWQVAPYLFFFGSFSTGKTRSLEVLSRLCQRGWLALYISAASLYRPVEAWRPTLFLDEAEVYGKRNEIIGLLNGSYRRGQYVCRQRETENEGYETDFFDCFGFKAIGGTKTLAKTLKSRCVIFHTTHMSRKINFFVDDERCTELRNKLLYWRFDTLLSEDTEHTEGNNERERLEQLVEKIGSQREVELFYPLIAVAPTKEIETELIRYAKTTSTRKLEELSLSAEAKCLSAILQCKQGGLMKNGKILISDITLKVNENLEISEQWKERYTSSLCTRLGFQRSRGTGGKAVIIWSQPLIERLRKDQRYALCFLPSTSPDSSERSEPSNNHVEELPI
jgi:hypothetical protein